MQNDIEKIINGMQIPTQASLNFKYETPKMRKSNKQKIAAYDINGYLIKTYNKVIDCEQDGFDATSVSKCIKGKRKIHNNFIFIACGKNDNPQLKIDTKEYKVRKNSTEFKNLQILKSITNPKPINTKKVHIPKRNRTRIGMFENDGTLFKVFLSAQEIEDYDVKARYTIYKHIYGDYSSKKLKKGYKGKYQYRRLEAGKTYNIGEKYNLDDIPFDEQKIFINRPSKKIDVIKEEPKSGGILQRILSFFNRI